MRLLCLLVLAAACGDGSPANPDATATADATGSGGGSGSGEVDISFGTAGTAMLTGTCQALAVDASDRPLVVTIDGPGHPTLTRLDSAGHVDATFTPRALGTDAIVFARVFALASGKVLVTTFPMPGTTAHVYRFAVDGTPDLDLEMPSALSAILVAAERTDGGIDLVGGGNDADHAFSFARITAAGAVDTTFGVQVPATPMIPPGYFAHGVSLGGGTFALSGASFTANNGPVTAHLLLASDGAITKTTTIDDTQMLDLARNGDKLYALATSYPDEKGSITRFDAMLTADPSFTSAESATIMPYPGIRNGSALAVAPDGSLIVSDGKTLARFHADGTTRSTLPYMFEACGVAFDTHDRPLVASATSVMRLVQ
ncbi:MAG TPA: hypothetical protein VLT45_23770 [Kofleriaceae bacterium]|nr:hypothetical protein [Kofleriaceae bacterium]